MEQLETDRLILREWKISDSKDLYEYAKSELVGPNAGWPPHETEETSKEIIRGFIESKCVYAVELKERAKVIGGIGLHERTPDPNLEELNQREIGYVLNPDYWGRGITPEAVKRLIDYGFEDLDLDIIWCGHYKENMKSKRVNEKCGFKYHMKKNEIITLLDNKEVETWYYKIDKNNYNNMRG